MQNHVGILGGGHYVSYACNPNGKWYLFNDSTVKEVVCPATHRADCLLKIPPERVTKESSYSYMLFYKRRDLGTTQHHQLYLIAHILSRLGSFPSHH